MALCICPSLKYFLQLCIFACTVGALPLENITLPLPAGTSNHGIPGLLCTPTKWTDIALFYLFNYVAHAATVLTRPGERSDDFIVAVVGSLLFPALGLYRGIEAVLSGAIFVKNDDIQKAAKSGALCMVVRGKDWRPVDGDGASNAVFRREQKDQKHVVVNGSSVVISWKPETANEGPLHVLTYSPPWLSSKFGNPVYVHRQIIHGTYDLPTGYRFVIVPSDTQFTDSSKPNTIVEVSATRNFMKALIALVQSVYALLTLYRSRGDQIQQFGYAAFGLTVAPYAVMSAINLIGNLCRPDYASLYMVENRIMDEARIRGGRFEGSVGRVQEESKTVCGCGLSDGDDAEELHFAVSDEEEITAIFGTSAPPKVWDIPHNSPRASIEKSAQDSLIQHSHTVKPLPEDLDYLGTENDALLLVPCCDPIQRRSTLPPIGDVPVRHRLEKLRLCKISPPFKRRFWYATFAPSAVSSRSSRWQIMKYLITTVIALIPLAVNGAMSRFQSGSIPMSEASTWKAYTMQWLILGVWCGVWWVFDQEGKDASPSLKAQFGPTLRVVLYVISSSPAIGGYIVVGQMLKRYGVCTWID